MFVCVRCLLENLPIQRSKHTKQLVAVVVAFARKMYHKEGCFLCNGRTVLGFIGLTVNLRLGSYHHSLCLLLFVDQTSSLLCFSSLHVKRHSACHIVLFVSW